MGVIVGITENMSRRSFMGMGAQATVAMGAGLAASGSLETARATEAFVPAGGSFAEGAAGDWTGTPAEIEAVGGSTMPLTELNRRRQAYLDSITEDWTCEDGTVIPNVYVKMRALINTYGMGCGNTPADNSWDLIKVIFTEDDALAFLQMPRGVRFTAMDFHAVSGRPVEECETILEKFAGEGFLCRMSRNNGTTYHQVALFQGISEYQLPRAASDREAATGVGGIDMTPNVYQDGGSPFFYAIPCDKSIMAEGTTVLPYDDVEAIMATKSTYAIAPCACRYGLMLQLGTEGCPELDDFKSGDLEDYFSPLCNQRVETCLMMGDEAEYWISIGAAREITREEALAYAKRSCEDGFILESCFTKDSETICSCHGDSCFIIGMWRSLGGAADVAAAPTFKQVSHYLLEVDTDACLKCGTCVDRCPLDAITMDEKTGLPVVNEMCFRCGQCAYICPVGARKLTPRPEEENMELPQDFLDDHNVKAAYRFEHGVIF